MVQLPICKAPFSRIKNPGSSITIDTAGKVLVIPTGDPAKLPSFNEYALNSNRLTIAESPFGGLKGAGATDYGVGTIYTPTANVSLTDVAGNNAGSILTPGVLKAANANYFLVDTSAKTITEEFMVTNTSGSEVTADIEILIPDYLVDYSLSLYCWNSTAYQLTGIYKLASSYVAVSTTSANWKYTDGTTLDSLYGAGGGRALFPKGIAGATVAGSTGNMTYSANRGTKYKIGLRVTLPASKSIRLKPVINYTDTLGNKVLDLSTNQLIGTVTGTIQKRSTGLFFDSSDDKITLPVMNNILSANGFTVVCEVTPTDFLTGFYYDKSIFAGASTNGFEIRIGNGKLNFSLRNQSGTSESASGTASLTAGQRYILIMTLTSATVTGFINGTLDKSTNAATSWNIIPTANPLIGNNPADSNRYFKGTIHGLNIYNGVWTQDQVTAYQNNRTVPTSPVYSLAAGAINSGATSYEFVDSTNGSYGLQNLAKPWIALYDPIGNYIDFFLFTHRPKNLIRRRDDSGNIYEMTLFPGNGSIYRGRIIHANITTDSNSDLVPDGISNNSETFLTSDGQNFLTSDSSYFDALTQSDGSISKFLSSYGMVI